MRLRLGLGLGLGMGLTSAGDETESGMASGLVAGGASAAAASPAAKGFLRESGIGGGSRLGDETDLGIVG